MSRILTYKSRAIFGFQASSRQQRPKVGEWTYWRSVFTASAPRDGLEHGFIHFDQIRDKAMVVRKKTAAPTREALLDLLGIEATLRARITRTEPLPHWPVVKHLRRQLIASTDSLASPQNQYPIMKLRTRIKSMQINEKGVYNINFDEQVMPHLADGVVFQRNSIDVWAP